MSENVKHEIATEEKGTGKAIVIGKLIFNFDNPPFMGNYMLVYMPPDPMTFVYYSDRHIPTYNHITDTII